MKEKLLWSVVVLLVGISSYFAGKMEVKPQQSTTPVVVQTISKVLLNEINGDTLTAQIEGPVRIVWADNRAAEGEGEHQIPLAQIPNAQDIILKNAAFVGNISSNKYYLSDSYHARGTAVADRRFFSTAAEAEAAGFEASKAN